MKIILSLIIGVAFVVSGFGQTRNVLVGTNSSVVQPTNFWSADAVNARAGLGLGSAATNPATAFQPASSILSNLVSGGALTFSNITIGITNVTGLQTSLDGKLGTNPTLLIANISNLQTTLDGKLTTNPTLAIANITGLQTSLDSKLSLTGNAVNLTNFPASLLRTTGDASGLTNFPTLNQNTAGTASNVTGVVALVNGGTGATNASGARTALELGTAATNPSTAFQAASSVLTNIAANNGGSLTNITAANIVGTVALASNITGTAPLATNVTGVVSIANGGTGTNSAAGARTAIGATTVGANLFTLSNPDDVRFLRLNANNTVSSLTAADFRTALSVGTNLGTVTSVGMTVPSFLSVSTPTITSSGTFAITLGNQTSRQLLITPNGGGVPAFRLLESDDLPSLAISKITGLQTSLDGKLSTSGTSALATNVTGVVALANGGTGGTNAASARSGLGATTIGENIFTIPNPSAVRFLRMNADNTVSSLSDSDFRTALSLGTAATNAATAFQTADSDLNALATNNGGNLTNITAANIVGTVALASNITGTAPLATNITGTVAIANGGTGATNVASARTSLGATTVGDSLFTLINPSAIRFLRLNADNTATALSASDFRTALSLGTAATNAETAFQPASVNLTSLAANNGSALSNIAIAGVTGLQTALDGKLSATGIAASASNVTGIVSLANGGTGATNAASARTALGATTIGSELLTLINPSAIRFLRLNADNTATALSASDFRTALSLGTAATNAETAFQPASTNLTPLANNNGSGLTNLVLSNVVGLQSALDGKIATNGSASGLTNFPSSLLTTNGNGGGLTNITAANITGTVGLASNISGVVAITNGGSGATTAGGARTNLGLGWSALTNSNAATSLLGFTTNGQVVANIGTNNLTFTNNVNIATGSLLRFDGGNAHIDASGFYATQYGSFLSFEEQRLRMNDADVFQWDSNGVVTFGNVAATRTNLGLGLPALTNTNAAGFNASLYGNGTNPVLYNTNGEVVSPTNFWQVAPISTTVQYQTNVVSTSTNAATNSRNLFLYSLATSVSGITNTITLPTNPATTFEGDRATITHLAQTTNAVTAIRQLGAATNLITLNQYEEAVLLIYRSGVWSLADNISYVEPIYFSGTNASANAAASRTNLGLGITNNVAFSNISGSSLFIGDTNSTALSITPSNTIFQSVLQINTSNGITFGGVNSNIAAAVTRTNFGLGASWLTNTNVTNFRTAVGLGATNAVTFGNITASGLETDSIGVQSTVVEFYKPIWIGDSGTNNVFAFELGEADQAKARTNLGLPLPALTNTSNANFRNAIELGATNNVSFSNVTASGTLTATGTVTATTNLVVNGFVDFSTNHTNSNPATNNQINDFIEIRVGTNQFWLPVYK